MRAHALDAHDSVVLDDTHPDDGTSSEPSTTHPGRIRLSAEGQVAPLPGPPDVVGNPPPQSAPLVEASSETGSVTTEFAVGGPSEIPLRKMSVQAT